MAETFGCLSQDRKRGEQGTRPDLGGRRRVVAVERVEVRVGALAAAVGAQVGVVGDVDRLQVHQLADRRGDRAVELVVRQVQVLEVGQHVIRGVLDDLVGDASSSLAASLSAPPTRRAEDQ